MCKRVASKDNIEDHDTDMEMDSDDSDTSMSDSDSSIDSTDSEDTLGQKPESEGPSISLGDLGDEALGREDAEEDEVVKAILRAREKVRLHPPDISCEDFVAEICFHPVEDLIVAATITGDAILYKYTNESTEIAETLELHLKACRDVEFSEDGTSLFSTSKDKSLMVSDMPSGKLKRVYENIHDVPVYCIHVLNENLIASGDDDGTVKLWDLRRNDPVFSLKEMEDFVSCMMTDDQKRLLVCGSGDGSVTTLNIGARKLHVQSEPYEAEFTSMGLMKSNSKLVTGTSKGKLYLFNWGEFGYHSDEFPGTKSAINSLVPITENAIVTAHDDGVIRATHLFPHRHLGVVGQHQLPVECLDISNDGHLIASFGHDHLIKFWNIKYFEDVEVDEKKKARKRKDMSHNLPSSKYQNPGDFFSGLAS